MRRSSLIYIPVVMMGWFAAESSAQAQSTLPADRSAYFNIHTDPLDAESPVRIKTEIRLRAMTQEHNVIGWYPLWIAITQYDDQGGIVESWTHLDPTMPEDRLWYVTHAEPARPMSSEFAMPPELVGTAESDTPNGPTLDYYLLGKNPGVSPVMPYPITSVLDYSFHRSDEPEPIDEDEDEPAETPEGSDNPS